MSAHPLPRLDSYPLPGPVGLLKPDLKAFAWMFRRELAVVAVLSFLSNLLMLVPTIYMLQIFDRVLTSQSLLTLLAVSLIALFLFTVLAVSEWLRSRVLVGLGMRLDERLSARVFNATFRSYRSPSQQGASRSSADLMQIRQFITGPGVFAMFDAPWAPLYIAVTFFLHPWLGMLSIAFALVQAGLAWFGHRHTLAPAEAATAAASESNAYLHGKLRSAELLESMGMMANLHRRWEGLHHAWLTRNAGAQGLTHRIAAWSRFIRYSQQSLALGAGALLVIDGQLTPGSMIAANILMARALAPIDQLVSTWRSFIGARSAWSRLGLLLSQYPEPLTERQAKRPTGEVVLKHVVATAEGRSAPILNHVSFTLAPGTVTAILGPSGAGKTTLAKALLGLWPDINGEVSLDGIPVQAWDRSELGPHLGYLPQDVELFEGSVAENIARLAFVDSDAVIAAARSAGLHEMILRFPKGYDTPVGEAGGLLSGGQKQRIGLARALYGNPALIVLDEPNANLDEAGESALLRALRELKAKGKTVVITTHRPSLIGVCDRLILLAEGAVVADGPRDVVLASLRRAPTTSASPASPAAPPEIPVKDRP
ncbi:MAG: type I secretion system permease/ATPase [Pseudomonadota bacterium]